MVCLAGCPFLSESGVPGYILKSLTNMVEFESLDYVKVITLVLHDVQNLHSGVFTHDALQKTLKKVSRRVSHEGMGFLTKTLPRLGKAFDKALAGAAPLNAVDLGFLPMEDSKLPLFLGELFSRVLTSSGELLQTADATCVTSLRQVLYLFYKLELPYEPELEQNVIEKFKQTEQDIRPISAWLDSVYLHLNEVQETHIQHYPDGRIRGYDDIKPSWLSNTIRGARRYLFEVFKGFDCMDIYPRHGPGAVSTRERLWDKYQWTNVPARITNEYPFDAYFKASPGHVCDTYRDFNEVTDMEDLARVVLVPKDSRGPRLISCEPLSFQWIQQGLSRAIVRHVERHRLTKDSVRFTDQQPNRFAALYGSKTGRYSTLDLAEASDRVSLGLVRALFPEPLLSKVLATRSLGTTLPDKTEIMLTKFAPMGSALCFPILALTVWSLLRSGLETFGATSDVISGVYVYGDDVVVPVEYTEHAIRILESFGLKVNRDKSCSSGLFRESCGMDAFNGVCVTPVRFRTPWTSHRSPESYESYISYANALFDRKYYRVYNYIVDRLLNLYGPIPEDHHGLAMNGKEQEPAKASVPTLRSVPDPATRLRSRYNKHLQKVEYRVWTSSPKKSNHELDGWSMLLRWFSEACSSYALVTSTKTSPRGDSVGSLPRETQFSVREYTWHNRNKLRRCWR